MRETEPKSGAAPPDVPVTTHEIRFGGDRYFRLLVEGIKDYAIFMLDPEGYVASWNEGAARIKGYRADEIIGQHFSRFYTEEARIAGRPMALLKEAAANGRAEEEAFRVRKDGTQFFADVILTAIRDETGIIGFAKVTRDLSERHRQEERLRQSEERFRLLVDSVKEYAIFMLDPDGYIVSWNAGAQGIKGYAAHEIIGRHFSTFYTPEAIATGWPATELKRARASGSVEDEGWRVRKDGSRFWANVVITALKNEDGELRGFTKITRDMSERQRVLRLEADARRMHDFVAMLGHELRNPIAPIANATMIAGHEKSSPAEREWALGVIRRQTSQLKHIVDDLLDVNRVARGVITLERKRVNLREALDAAIEMVAPGIAENHHQLQVEAPDRIEVIGDMLRLTQIISNLLTNAVKYTLPGGRIDVFLSSDANEVRLRVRDTGIGMPPDLLEHVFELFVQGDFGLERSEGGLGLGLTIARQLAVHHGGTITAHSAGPGCGSEFVLALPQIGAQATLAEEP